MKVKNGDVLVLFIGAELEDEQRHEVVSAVTMGLPKSVSGSVFVFDQVESAGITGRPGTDVLSHHLVNVVEGDAVRRDDVTETPRKP